MQRAGNPPAVAQVTERVALGGQTIASFMPLHRGLPGGAHAEPDERLTLALRFQQERLGSYAFGG